MNNVAKEKLTLVKASLEKGGTKSSSIRTLGSCFGISNSGEQKKIVGILTIADLSEELQNMMELLLIAGEIKGHLRLIFVERFRVTFVKYISGYFSITDVAV